MKQKPAFINNMWYSDEAHLLCQKSEYKQHMRFWGPVH